MATTNMTEMNNDDTIPRFLRDPSVRTMHSSESDPTSMSDNSNQSQSQANSSTPSHSSDSEQQGLQRKTRLCIFSNLLHVLSPHTKACFRPPTEKSNDRSRNGLCCGKHNSDKFIVQAEYVIQSLLAEKSKIQRVLSTSITEAPVLAIDHVTEPELPAIHSFHLVFRTQIDHDRMKALLEESHIPFTLSSLTFSYSDKALAIQHVAGATPKTKFKVKVDVVVEPTVMHKPGVKRSAADGASAESQRKLNQPGQPATNAQFAASSSPPPQIPNFSPNVMLEPLFALQTPNDHNAFALTAPASPAPFQPAITPTNTQPFLIDTLTASSVSQISFNSILSNEGRNKLTECQKTFSSTLREPMMKLSRWANENSGNGPAAGVAEPSLNANIALTGNQIAYDEIPMDESRWYMKYVALDADYDPVANVLNESRRSVLDYWEQFWVHAAQPGFLEECVNRSWPGAMRFREFLRIIEPMEKGHYLLVRRTYVHPRTNPAAASASQSQRYSADQFKQTYLCKQMRAMAMEDVSLAQSIMSEKAIRATEKKQAQQLQLQYQER